MRTGYRLPGGWACSEPHCVDGACAYEPVACDDGNPCTYDHCQPDIGCVHEVVAHCGTPCQTSETCPPPGCAKRRLFGDLWDLCGASSGLR